MNKISDNSEKNIITNQRIDETKNDIQKEIKFIGSLKGNIDNTKSALFKTIKNQNHFENELSSIKSMQTQTIKDVNNNTKNM